MYVYIYIYIYIRYYGCIHFYKLCWVIYIRHTHTHLHTLLWIEESYIYMLYIHMLYIYVDIHTLELCSSVCICIHNYKLWYTFNSKKNSKYSIRRSVCVYEYEYEYVYVYVCVCVCVCAYTTISRDKHINTFDIRIHTLYSMCNVCVCVFMCVCVCVYTLPWLERSHIQPAIQAARCYYTLISLLLYIDVT